MGFTARTSPLQDNLPDRGVVDTQHGLLFDSPIYDALDTVKVW
jgi:hypothetical protein